MTRSVRRAHCGRALRLILRLNDHAIEWSRGNEAATHYADAAQWISRIRSTMPHAPAVAALKDYAGRRAGREKPLAGRIVGDGADVFVRQAVEDVLPVAAVRAAECAFTRGDQNLAVGKSHTVNARYKRREHRRQLPGRAAVLRCQECCA